MPVDRNTAAKILSTNRSKLTNRPRKLAGVDGRSTEGRRRRDLIDTFVAALGGTGSTPDSVMLDIVRAADLTIVAERARADALRGESVDLSALARIEGVADRAVRRLGIKLGGVITKKLTLADYAAAKARNKASRSHRGAA